MSLHKSAPLRFIWRKALRLISLGLLIEAILAGCGQPEPPAAAAPVEVTAVTVQPKTVPLIVPYVAQIQSSHQVDIMARVSGFLQKIGYKDGEPVRQGQVLFELDKKPLAAEAEAAKAEVEMKQSELFTAKANLDRIMPLAQQQAASRKSLDEAIGTHKKAEAALHHAKAKYDKALLDVGYATITSPVEGVAGQALIREGGYISDAGASTKLTTVSRLDPVWVEFSISQNQQDTLHQEVVDGRLLLPQDGQFTVELELAQGVRYPHSGKVTFSEARYNKDTGSYRVRAEIANPMPAKYMLIPGMFVKAYLKGAQRPNVLAVPQRAVRQGSNGHEVFVVTDQGLAELRPVTAGDWVDHDWIITQGLKPGDQVVVDGAVKLFPGMPVKVVPPEQNGGGQSQQPAVR